MAALSLPLPTLDLCPTFACLILPDSDLFIAPCHPSQPSSSPHLLFLCPLFFSLFPSSLTLSQRESGKGILAFWNLAKSPSAYESQARVCLSQGTEHGEWGTPPVTHEIQSPRCTPFLNIIHTYMDYQITVS